MQYKMPPVVHCSVMFTSYVTSRDFWASVSTGWNHMNSHCWPCVNLNRNSSNTLQKSINSKASTTSTTSLSFFFQFSLLIIPWVSRPRPAEKHSTIVTGSEHFKCISVVGGGTCFLHFYPGGSQPLSEINLNIRGLESTTSCLFHSLFLEFVLCRHNASRRPNKRQNILIYVLFYTSFFFKIKKIKCITLGH